MSTTNTETTLGAEQNGAPVTREELSVFIQTKKAERLLAETNGAALPRCNFVARCQSCGRNLASEEEAAEADPCEECNPEEEDETPSRRYFRLSYAFDVPHYADFVLEAASEEDAHAIAKRLLDAGTLAEICYGHANACWETQTNDRVFCSDETGPSGPTSLELEYETLPAMAKENGITLPPGWDTPPAPEPKPEPFDFEALCNNVAAAPDLDTEADAFRTLAEFAWEHMSEEGRAAMLARQDVKDLIARSESWAMHASGELDEDDDEPVTLGDVPGLPPAGSC